MNQNELHEALRSLAAENAATPVPAGLEAKVLAAFDARHTRTRWWFPATAAALVASGALAVFLMHRPTPARQAPMPQAKTAPFTAIPYVAPPAPYERTEVMRMNVPLAALIAAGLEVRETNSRGSVRADVLVGQDGRPLAIRLVKNSI
jgi:hypothetical protein